MLYASETWPVEDADVIRLERNDVMMIRLTCNLGLRTGFPQRHLELD